MHLLDKLTKQFESSMLQVSVVSDIGSLYLCGCFHGKSRRVFYFQRAYQMLCLLCLLVYI